MIMMAAALALFGCATRMTTKSFMDQEAAVTRECMAPVNAMPMDRALQVNPSTGQSQMAAAAVCYSHKASVAAWAGEYRNAQLVEDFGAYLVKLTAARDRGLIDTPSALSSYQEAAAQFRRAIAVSDATEERRRMREFGDRLQVFAQTLSVQMMEQDRIRAANRPVICSSLGVYRSTEIVCQ
jgi:hypothetical protein